MLVSKWEVSNAPSHDGHAPHTSQQVPTRLPQVSLHKKDPRSPGFSMEEEQTPGPASKPKFEGPLKGWKWCHNMERMLLPWNFAIGIHGKPLFFWPKGQLHMNAGSGNSPNHGCTKAQLPSYTGRLQILQQSRPPGTPGQSSRLISCSWSYPKPTCSSIYEPQLCGSQKSEKFFPAFWEISKKIEEIVSNLVLTN